MIPSSMEADFPTKQESSSNNSTSRFSSSSSTTPWLKSKDPRIVRVSRAFGTKDRHSKVCTVRGLRDRRVRLSVPTAIQLYDLQDRLGLNQPSKVFDWLINAAKDEIDELPPLQMPPSGRVITGSSAPSIWEDQRGLPNLNLWNDSTTFSNEEEKWRKRYQDQEKQEVGIIDNENTQLVSSSNIFPRNNHHSSLQGLLFNNVVPYGSYNYHLEPSNFTPHQTNDQLQDHQNFNVFLCPQGTTTTTNTTQTYFPCSHIPSTSIEFDPRQINHFHMLSSTPSTSQNPLSSTTNITPPLFSIGQSMRPFQFSMTTKDRDSRNDERPNRGS